MTYSEELRPVKFDYFALDSVRTGLSVAAALPELINQRQVSSVLIVASATLSKHCDGFSALIESIQAVNPTTAVEVFCGIRTHTPREDVLSGLVVARQVQADLLVSIGGGSVIDAVKVIQLALDQDITTEDELIQFARGSQGKGSKVGDLAVFTHPPTIRQIAVPTTLSGAEFSNNAGVLDTKLSAKEGYLAPSLCPQAIIYDPELVLLTPTPLWFSTAIRSLDHAIEGYCSADCHAYVASHFLAGIKLLAASLPQAYANPKNSRCRQENQTGVWLACCGLGTISHGASHGIGYILGSLCGMPHGITSCLMLPAVLEWNSVINSDRQKEIAIAMGAAGTPAHAAVKALVANLGLPTGLEEAGVSAEQLPLIAEQAFAHPVVKNNPRPITCPDHVIEILRLAW